MSLRPTIALHCLAAIGLLNAAAAPLRAQDISVTTIGKGQASTFDHLEWSINVGRSYDNPFDPDEVSVDAEFTAPDDTMHMVPAFWSEATSNSDDAHSALPNSGWYVRYAPPQAGHWQVVVVVHDKAGERKSPPVTFDVNTSSNPGFLRRGNPDATCLRFDSGKSVFLIGINLCWPGDGGLPSYDRLFTTFSDVGGNFARIWMAAPHSLENKRAGLGRYDQSSAAYYDAVLEDAQRHGLRVMLTLDDYRKLAESDYFGHTDWQSSPYNAANGGPLQHPMEFFTNPTAIKLYRQRLRYLVARYAAYTSLGMWEMWNEQDNLPKPSLPTAWEAQMTSYLRQIDPARHLITTSYSWQDKPEVWKLPDIDLTQRHMYGTGDIVDFVAAVVSDAHNYEVYHKPHIIGEFGITWKEPDVRFDPSGTGTSLHNACWAAMMSGDAGIPMSWWWDNYIEPKNLWHVYRGVAKFAASVDWSRPWQPLAGISAQWTTVASPVYSDMHVPVNAGWGQMPEDPVVVSPDGETNISFPGFIFGPAKPGFARPLNIRISLPHDSQLVLHVDKVSDRADLHISIDGVPSATLSLNASPGSPDQESTAQLPDNPRQYQAVISKDYRFPVPAGQHTISFQDTSGDWLKIGSLTFTDALSSLYVDLKVLGLTDAATGNSLVWLCSPASTWKYDMQRSAFDAMSNVQLIIPIPRASSRLFQAEWWDTRTGTVVGNDLVPAKDQSLRLTVPSFQRDIALKLSAHDDKND